MTTPRPSTGPTPEQLREEVIFADPDPRVQRLKALWEEAKTRMDALF